MSRRTVKLFIAMYIGENAYSIKNLTYILIIKKCNPKEVFIQLYEILQNLNSERHQERALFLMLLSVNYLTDL